MSMLRYSTEKSSALHQARVSAVSGTGRALCVRIVQAAPGKKINIALEMVSRGLTDLVPLTTVFRLPFRATRPSIGRDLGDPTSHFLPSFRASVT